MFFRPNLIASKGNRVGYYIRDSSVSSTVPTYLKNSSELFWEIEIMIRIALEQLFIYPRCRADGFLF